MDLLEFARGPALQFAALVLVGGTIWRIVGIAFLGKKPDYSEPRGPGGLGAALKVIYTRAFTAAPFKKATLYPKIMAYVMHIGLFAMVFLFTPHIVFFEGWLGFDWPGLPNSIIFFIGGCHSCVGCRIDRASGNQSGLEIDFQLRRLLQLVRDDAAAGYRSADSRSRAVPLRRPAGDTHTQRRTAIDLAAVRQAGTHLPRFHYPRHDRHGL